MKSDCMPTLLAISVLAGLSVGLLYAHLFKKQTKFLLAGIMKHSANESKTKIIGKHIFFLMSRFLVIIAIVFGLKYSGLVDLQVCGISLICGFLISLFIQTKRML